MKFHLYNLILLCLLYTSVTHSAENKKPFLSGKDAAIGAGMMLLFTVAHESGHAFANYLAGGELIEMNIGSQDNGNQRSYASLGKIRLTGFNPASRHVKIRNFHPNKKRLMQRDILVDWAGPLMGIITSALSLYMLNKYDPQEDYRIVHSICLASLLSNTMQLLPFKLFGCEQDGWHAYETYKKLKNFKHSTCQFGFFSTKRYHNLTSLNLFPTGRHPECFGSQSNNSEIGQKIVGI